MIIKDLEYPIHLELLKALLPRISPNHPKYPTINGEFITRSAGYRGEKEVLRQLKRLPIDDFFILCSIRLKQGEFFFHPDFVVLSPFVIVIVETKNIQGTLFFDTRFNQMIRMTEEKEEGFRNPLSQADYQKQQLQRWLLSHQLDTLPVEYLVAISNPATVLKTDNQDPSVYQKVVHAENLAEHILALEKKYTFTNKPKQQLEPLYQALLKHHTDYHLNILEYFDLDKNDIITGVPCPSCGYLPMERLHGKWWCTACKSSNKSAHEQAIHDFLLLIQPTITNTQSRNFLHLSSRNIAYHLLSDMNLTRKGRNYMLEK